MKAPICEWIDDDDGEWSLFADALVDRLVQVDPSNRHGIRLVGWRCAELFGLQSRSGSPADAEQMNYSIDRLTDKQKVALDCIIGSGDTDDPRVIAVEDK